MNRMRIWVAAAAVAAGVAGLVPFAGPAAARGPQPCHDITDGTAAITADLVAGTRTVTVRQTLAGPACGKATYTLYATADGFDESTGKVILTGGPDASTTPASGSGVVGDEQVFTLTLPDDDLDVCVWADVSEKGRVLDRAPDTDCLKLSLVDVASLLSGGGTFWK